MLPAAQRQHNVNSNDPRGWGQQNQAISKAISDTLVLVLVLVIAGADNGHQTPDSGFRCGRCC